MLRLARAELNYSLASILAWVAVAIVSSWWPLVEAGNLSAAPGALAMMALTLPLITPVQCFLLLNVERNERRQRLWGMLPVAPATIAGARLLRAAYMPLFAIALGLFLVALAAVFTGTGVIERLNGAWSLGFLLLAGFALGALVTLLYDVAGMAFAQATSVLLIAGGFLLNRFVPAFTELVTQVPAVAQTAAGMFSILGLCVVLVAADVLVYRARRR